MRRGRIRGCALCKGTVVREEVSRVLGRESRQPRGRGGGRPKARNEEQTRLRRHDARERDCGKKYCIFIYQVQRNAKRERENKKYICMRLYAVFIFSDVMVNEAASTTSRKEKAMRGKKSKQKGREKITRGFTAL